jgi:hypothetical protein
MSAAARLDYLIDRDGGRILSVFAISNPDKLAAIASACAAQIAPTQ